MRKGLAKEGIRLKNLGFSFFPVNQEKVPTVKWSEFRTRLPEESEIKDWFSSKRNGGMAIVTGKEFDFFILDIEKEGIDILGEREFPNTVCSLSGGGGIHFFYKYPNFPLKSVTKILENVDVKADGGCATIPPSLHQSGNEYCWINKLGDIEMCDPPGWLYNILLEKYLNNLGGAHSVSLGEAIHIFGKKDLFIMAYGHINAGDNVEHWEELLDRIRRQDDQKMKERINYAKQIPMDDLVRRFGYEPRMGYISCPFHEEKTASLKIYSNSWCCYGCDSGSSTIDFVMKHQNLDFKDAVDYLN